MKHYGKELILDLHNCDVSKFNRKCIKKYLIELCKLIDMKRCDLHFWDDVGVPEDEVQTLPHTKGTSGVQFILTSNITFHSLELLERIYINIFSCKDFSTAKAERFTADYFQGDVVNSQIIKRI